MTEHYRPKLREGYEAIKDEPKEVWVKRSNLSEDVWYDILVIYFGCAFPNQDRDTIIDRTEKSLIYTERALDQLDIGGSGEMVLGSELAIRSRIKFARRGTDSLVFRMGVNFGELRGRGDLMDRGVYMQEQFQYTINAYLMAQGIGLPSYDDISPQ